MVSPYDAKLVFISGFCGIKTDWSRHIDDLNQVILSHVIITYFSPSYIKSYKH